MANLISPNVSVTIIDESFYVAGRPASLPLFFVATADEKTQLDGQTPAIGTYEHGVLRVVTSIKQALELYGVPNYLYSADGTPHHGDVRSEFGLDGLLKYLEVGNRAYVVRANVNLDDNPAKIKSRWTDKIADAALYLEDLVQEYLDAYNDLHGLIPADQYVTVGDLEYRDSVTASEAIELLSEALSEVYSSYSYGSDEFKLNFERDHTISHAGFQDVQTITSSGFITGADATGYVPGATYGAKITVVASATTNHVLSFDGADAVTFQDVVDLLNVELTGSAIATLVAGRIRITSDAVGVTSSVVITEDGNTLDLGMFRSLNQIGRASCRERV